MVTETEINTLVRELAEKGFSGQILLPGQLYGEKPAGLSAYLSPLVVDDTYYYSKIPFCMEITLVGKPSAKRGLSLLIDIDHSEGSGFDLQYYSIISWKPGVEKPMVHVDHSQCTLTKLPTKEMFLKLLLPQTKSIMATPDPFKKREQKRKGI